MYTYTHICICIVFTFSFGSPYSKPNHWSQERASRAIDLPRSWGSASDPDSALWQMAELVPGADAVAFAVHLQGGAPPDVSLKASNR